MTYDGTRMTHDDPSQIRMEVGIPLDAHSCVRVACPNCGLDFKVAMGREDLHDVVAWSVGRARQAEVIRNDDSAAATKFVHCPYCACSAASQDFLHPEHWAYLKRLAYREYVEPMLSRMFSSAFSGLRDSKFLRVTHSVGPRSPRPIVGPEPTDMARVRCLACAGLFKVYIAWRGSVGCPHCGIELLAI